MAILLPERRSSILVEAHVLEDGPKNPLKGISMKLLVAAFCAQLWVAAGRSGSRAVRNGIRNSTLFPWRPCQVVKTLFSSELRLRARIKPIARYVDAVNGVACLEAVMADNGTLRPSWP